MKTAPIQRSLIPEEIIVYEILKRLPVKTLCRFRAVSKRWLSIINSRRFVDCHFQQSELNPTCLFGFYNKDTTTQHPPTFFSANYPQTSSYNWPDTCYRWCSISSRGLICFYGDDTAAQIWNPSTGEHIEVNPPPRKLRKTYPLFLGFDPDSEKHKLLSFGKGENYVFTLGENIWRKTVDSSSNLTPIHMRNCCNIYGIVYYLARRDKTNSDELVLGRFDLVSETFLEPIHFPGDLVRFPYHDNTYFNSGIYVYRGMVLMLNYDHIRTGFQMWVLEKHHKWSPQILIPWSPPSSEYYNVGFIDGKGLLIYSSEFDANSESNFRLCSYDLEKGSGWTEVTFPDISKKLVGSAIYVACLYCYVDTLESLKSFSIEQEEEKEKSCY